MSTSTSGFDFIVIGAGMAGASIAAFLSTRGRVGLLEAESQPGYHTTGRSAAVFSQIYGNPVIRALSRASRGFLFDPPPGFSATPLVRPRETLYFAGAGQVADLLAWRQDADVAAFTRMLTAAQVHERLPVLREEELAAGALETGSADIDVHALHQGFLRAARTAGATLALDARVMALRREGGAWRAESAAGRWHAPVVVNAAGAWADAVATLAGLSPLGLQPLRRTALLIDAPPGLAVDTWPTAIAADESFYFKPDAGALLLSPADETPSPPCDAQPEELDVALAVDRFEQATGQGVRRVRHRWAGLRVFAPDRTPVAGFDARAPGFFWLAGLGGYGIQTAAGLGRLAAGLAAGEAVAQDIAAHGVSAQSLAPDRLIERLGPPQPNRTA